MTCFRNRLRSGGGLRPVFGCVVLAGFCVAAVARANLPLWQQTVVSATAIEQALFRVMQLPAATVSYPRPPREAAQALGKLLGAQPSNAELYALRAQMEEQALDLASSQADWTAFVAHAVDKTEANRRLADYFARRLDGPREIAALEAAANAPAAPSQAFLPAHQQSAWQDFLRALGVAQRQALGSDAELAIYAAWIARYPAEPAARANAIVAMLRLKRLHDASAAIAAYRQAFPHDVAFPVKASAVVAAAQGGPDAAEHALAIYDAAYQPLWPADLSQGYFALLEGTRTQHLMLANARAALTRNPDDLSAVTRIVHYYQQAGRADAAAEAIAQYRASKEARHAAWSADELFAFATLLGQSGLPEEAARYNFALASVTGELHLSTEPTGQLALAGVIDLLLSNPDKPINLGAGNLAIYRDLATVDTGPGYWNGILSLWLNSTSPASELANEEAKATPYFHRAKAAELLAVLDEKYPAAPERDRLHAALIRAYIAFGEDDAVIAAGTTFLNQFPQSQDRLDIALAVADADARKGNTTAEFSLYESVLSSLGESLHGMPLTAGGPSADEAAAIVPATPGLNANEGYELPNRIPEAAPDAPKPSTVELLLASLQAPVQAPPAAASAAAYHEVLERYLGRLTATNQLPAALEVLRHQLDRNPDDPLLYDRLAAFLAQNDLSAQQEQIYQSAIQRFNSPAFYNKLARFYLRQKRRRDFSALTRKVTDIFSGTELEAYFNNVNRSWPQLYLELNLYAHARFPHDLRFTRNLLTAYQATGTVDANAREKLLREHWWEASDLQSEFFEYLSRTHKLSAELDQLQSLVPANDQAATDISSSNIAAARELSALDLWQSHFEQGAPLLGHLAQVYPADPAIGDDAASVFRSLAYHDPAQIAHAVVVERNLAAAQPANLDRLATIGDIYANSVSPELTVSPTVQLAQADPYWTAMSAVQPGVREGYLQSATIFWDYFQFDKALAQIEAARQRFGNPTVYGFEAGALDEDMGKPALAIEEYARAAANEELLPGSLDTASTTDALAEPAAQSSGDDATAKGRLLVLARRSATAPAVDSATARILASTRSLGALQLRVEVLRAQHRPTEIAAPVQNAIAEATDVDELTQLVAFSEHQHLPGAYVQALNREVSLATDPVERIELQYNLVDAYDDQGDTVAAQGLVESVYRDHPKILGVVRTTVDFYWNHKQPKRAVETLEKAASQANPSLAHDFTLEAISKSNASADFAGARTLLQPLLSSDRFNPRYISLEADSFALAHDDPGLRDFYLKTLSGLRDSSLPAPARRADIALARRALIPALTNLKDYPGATEQYIALLQAFPEDTDLLQQAALYARRYNREPQLLSFLSKAIADSPRDSRFAIDLGRADEIFGDPAAALTAYSQAIAIRQDRPDLYIARAAIEEHREDFDSACADYSRLFTLSYNDPQWMEKAALARERQREPALAVEALEAAWITNRPASPNNAFRVAAQLEQWNQLPEARSFAERGLAMAGDGLLGDARFADGVKTYTTILARQREPLAALDKLLVWSASAHVSSSSPTIILQQAQQQGIAALTDAQWRDLRAKRRDEQAKQTLSDALTALGHAVATFYTPEEKLTYARLLDAHRATASVPEIASLWIPAAHEAGLLDREATWRRDLLLGGDVTAQAQLQPFIELEQRRMDFATLASTLDIYAQRLPQEARQLPEQQRVNILDTAVESWRSAGDPAHETRDLRMLVITLGQTQWQSRLFALLLQSDPPSLLALASANAPYSDAAATYAFAHGKRELAYRAIAAGARGLPPVWDNTNTALAGLYFRNVSAPTDAAFRSALDDVTIGARLSRKPDTDRSLAGGLWFALATRYGVYRTLAPASSGDPEDFLPAELEGSPGSAQAHLQLAGTYLNVQQQAAAIAEFRHALELDPTNPIPSIAIAEQLWAEGKHDDALTLWRDAIVQLRNLVAERNVPETFWLSFARLAKDIGDDDLHAPLDPGLSNVLHIYIRKNDTYRTSELLQAAFLSQKTRGPEAAATFALSFIADAQNPLTLLNELESNAWFPPLQLGLVYRRQLALTERSHPAIGLQDPDSFSELDLIRSRYLGWLLQNNKISEAQQLFNTLPAAKQSSSNFAPYAIQLAAMQSRLTETIAAWDADPRLGPPLEIISNAAEQLRRSNHPAASRSLLEYLFTRKLNENNLQPTDYLALAEARLAAQDIAGALDLLHRFTLQADDFYGALDSATQLLTSTGHHADAIPFLQKLADGTPWKFSNRERLGEAQQQAGDIAAAINALRVVATSQDAPYALRAHAAMKLRGSPVPQRFTSLELTLLAGSAPPSPQAADQPYFTYARLLSALATTSATGAQMLHAAIAIAPESLLSRLQLALFYAESTAGHDDQASAAIKPLITRFPDITKSGASPYDASEVEIGRAVDGFCGGENCPVSSEALPEELTAPADHRRLLLALASVYERQHELARAVQMLQIAKTLGGSQEGTAVESRIVQLTDELAREHENDARRPVLQSPLLDSGHVRPMLLPGSPLPSAAATESEP